MKQFFDKKLGDFLKVDKDNVQFNAASGQITLKKAEFKADVFDQLHFPVALKGGFIDEMAVNIPMSMFSTGAAKVTISNIFFVFGPHVTDWSWDHVFKCKTRLIELVQKVNDLRSPAKKKKGPAKKGLFIDWQ